MTRVSKGAGLILTGLALALAACGGGAGGTGEGGWIVGLLDRIPDTGGSGEVTVVDLTAAAAAVGIAVPPAGASDPEISDYLLGLPRDALVPDLLRDPAPRFSDLTGELGIDPAQVTAAITAGTPPETYQVLAGSFDAAAIDETVRTEPDWSDLLTTGEHRGVAYYTWGADFESDIARVTPVRPLGRGGRLGLDDGYLYWAFWTAGIEGLIDAGAGGAATLADDAPLAQAARALETEGVYSAILTDTPLLDDPVSGLALGLGGGRDDAGAFWVVVAVHDSAAAAEESAAAVRSILSEGTILSTGEPWSERVSGFEVTVEGDMLVAVVRAAAGEGDWMRAYYTRESLVLAAQV